jgi:hypothetical protein
MATVKRGKAGVKNESPIRVLPVRRNLKGSTLVADVDADIIIELHVTAGQPVTAEISHDEALQFLADLAKRLAQRISPPTAIDVRPKAKRML